VNVVNLVFDGWRKESGEPPGSHPGPQGRMDSVECFQVFPIVIRKLGIDLLQPPIRDQVFTACPKNYLFLDTFANHSYNVLSSLKKCPQYLNPFKFGYFAQK